MTGRVLTDDEKAILELERGWWAHGGTKAAEIRRRFGWSETRHCQLVNALIDRDEAEAWDAVLVRRLRRLRDVRREARRSA